MSKIILPKGYKPSEEEEYMSPNQLEYFKQKLEKWKEELIQESLDTIDHLKDGHLKEPDLNYQASREADTAIELKTRSRYKKLIDKIETALKKIELKQYGYCEESGEKIGLKRLEARPIATLCIESQERHEKYEKQHNDDYDAD
ncbi:RNA polymerase-binding protein DksA [Orientia tsutsugamushi str. Gilliam]|uniref:RNA polymerase-binding transcription factor DksA n=3 Tax=Orientia tsutsugamushi TaxID=784 RepID=A0A0F3M9R6_ORITS|nr:RNA polymerase-binding protein DksA [Orientia tsutsugamushi]KJV75716.1 RNA polymerase-binding protein DksA [Orientia tsutsugamushi str. TA763]KJV91346.1 RNA polymerase-binding protein DksA [Orientia tsutsugamushi str. UT76]KJV52212.1 RNA polymerase-binding protein DksA [Orientia tsutsugamushi str. Gilliam]KJV57354.1 RNA polymerase-binding protein DksA [Orientia tsutsugamushi str. Karp]KJV72825.1 RNA polymerase-binding protein DksA [Orientia tsutsugamushi str. TA716]